MSVKSANSVSGRATTSGRVPPLAGSYTSSTQHPRVFTNQKELTQLAKRSNVAGSFSAQNFSRLTTQIKQDLAAKVDWAAAYSGCDLAIYLRTFSYEARTGYAAEVRSEEQLKSALRVRNDATAPAGAALVAARLALYAALLKAGATPLEQAPEAEAAAQLAKQILLAWAERGFRDAKGARFQSSQQFCGNDGKPEDANVGLQLGRGVVYSVQAQDLLQAQGALNSAEVKQLNAFHLGLFDLIRLALNRRVEQPMQDCERYSNHSAAALTGMLSIARLLDDGKRFNAVLKGGDAAYPVALPWLVQFNRAIYGEGDSPVACYPNPGKDSLTSKPSFQTAKVEPGEIEDRYRNANPLQGIGYPMFALELITNGAAILQQAGFDAWGYRGAQQQSIGAAIAYYACYGKVVGFNKTVTAENAKSCPNHAQYVGKMVHGVESMVLLGSARYPKNAEITELEEAARKGRMVVDGVRFGMWRD
ncbi:hypothetical protein V8J88_21490 [Massilia sp. W12]|uniref:hypothetical protein n=1 Tax=Massilia sp. W12 TaxID=3126507 RepID=UPI0030CABABF